MNQSVKVLALSFIISAFSVVSFAKSDSPLNNGKGYGNAGCGLGSMVFGDQKGPMQILAATTNGTSGSQTFGISSGTSNCGESGKLVKVEQFIDVNRTALENEISRGQGEYTLALKETMNCQNDNFSQVLRKTYQNQHPEGGASSEQMTQIAFQACKI